MKLKLFPSISTLLIFVISFFLIVACQDETEEAINEVPVIESEAFGTASVSEGTYYILNRNSGKSLDLDVSNGNIHQYSYWGGANQNWIIDPVGDSYFKISSSSDPSLSLGILDQSLENGANVLAYSYSGGTNQQFEIVDLANGYFKIINRNSGKVLDVADAATQNKGNVIQWEDTSVMNQEWNLIQIGGDTDEISWVMTSTNVPQDVLDRITTAMDAAVARYNDGAEWPSRTLTVEYNTGVPTADANFNGHIRFGAGIGYQNERTALHEIAHTWGVGTSSLWSANISEGKFVGSNAVALMQTYNGEGATISTGGAHFWPYGLNFNSEWSETNAQRHVQMVWAMVQDGIY